VITENKGDTKKAIEYYQKSVDNGKYYLAYENLAKLYFKSGDYHKSSEFCQKSLMVLPNNQLLWIILAYSEYKLGNKEEALGAAKNAYSLTRDENSYLLYQKILKNEPLEL
jgi:tetratricopeptide (TPR) repeat protein